MTARRPIATLASAIAELRHLREQLAGERARAAARFDALGPPTAAAALADPEVLAGYHLARFATGLGPAEAAEDEIDEAIGRLEEALLAAPAGTLAELAVKVRTIERQMAAGGEMEAADLASIFADIHRLAHPP